MRSLPNIPRKPHLQLPGFFRPHLSGVVALIGKRPATLGGIVERLSLHAKQAQHLAGHNIPKMKFRVQNWAEYDASLQHRGSLTFWVTAEVLGGWTAAHRSTPDEAVEADTGMIMASTLTAKALVQMDGPVGYSVLLEG